MFRTAMAALLIAFAPLSTASGMTAADSEALIAGAAWRRAWEGQAESKVVDMGKLLEEATTIAGQSSEDREGMLDAMQGTIEEEIVKARKRASLLEAAGNEESAQLDRVSKAFENFKKMESLDPTSRGMFLATLCRNVVSLRCDTTDCINNLNAVCRV